MKIILTGASGKLGRELSVFYPNAYRPTHGELDIRFADKVNEYVFIKKPDIIIHTAAQTNVRLCEEDKNLAWQTNVVGTNNLVNSCLKLKKRPYFVYISTACVFEGTRGNYLENDIPYPKNFYGLTKLISEVLITNSGIKHLIARTNFVARKPWPYPKAFVDRYGTYIFASTAAKGLKELIDKKIEGIIHLTGTQKLSMFDLAKSLSPKIEPITMKQYQGPSLTIDMSLDSKRWKKYKLK